MQFSLWGRVHDRINSFIFLFCLPLPACAHAGHTHTRTHYVAFSVFFFFRLRSAVDRIISISLLFGSSFCTLACVACPLIPMRTRWTHSHAHTLRCVFCFFFLSWGVPLLIGCPQFSCLVLCFTISFLPSIFLRGLLSPAHAQDALTRAHNVLNFQNGSVPILVATDVAVWTLFIRVFIRVLIRVFRRVFLRVFRRVSIRVFMRVLIRVLMRVFLSVLISSPQQQILLS
jgi:small-conductance mechanosensitive channel